MKLTGLALSATLIIAGALAAQEPPRDQPPGRGPRPPGPEQPGARPQGPGPGGMQAGRPMAGNLFPPELIMHNAERIGLTDQQRQAIEAEINKAHDLTDDLHRKVREENAKLDALLKSERVDENAVNAQLDKLLAAEGEVKKAHLGVMVRIKNQLTGQQQGQLKEIQQSMTRQRGAGGPPPEGGQGLQRGPRPQGPPPEGGEGFQRGQRPQGPPPEGGQRPPQ